MVWLTSMIVGFPLVFYLPAHLMFRDCPTARRATGRDVAVSPERSLLTDDLRASDHANGARCASTSNAPNLPMMLLGASAEQFSNSSARSFALTADRRAAYDFEVELRITVNIVQSSDNAYLGGEPSTKPYSKPRPYRPGEVGILGFVDSALESSQRSPETRPPGGSRGFLFFEPRVSIERHRGQSDRTS